MVFVAYIFSVQFSYSLVIPLVRLKPGGLREGNNQGRSFELHARLACGELTKVVTLLSLCRGELRDDLAKVLAVVHGNLLLVLGRLARAVAPRDRAGAVGRTAVDLRQVEEQRGRGAHGHEEHAVVGELVRVQR